MSHASQNLGDIPDARHQIQVLKSLYFFQYQLVLSTGHFYYCKFSPFGILVTVRSVHKTFGSQSIRFGNRSFWQLGIVSSAVLTFGRSAIWTNAPRDNLLGLSYNSISNNMNNNYYMLRSWKIGMPRCSVDLLSMVQIECMSNYYAQAADISHNPCKPNAHKRRRAAKPTPLPSNSGSGLGSTSQSGSNSHSGSTSQSGSNSNEDARDNSPQVLTSLLFYYFHTKRYIQQSQVKR